MDCLIVQVEEQRVIAARFEVTVKTVDLRGAAEFELGGDTSLQSVAGRIAEGLEGTPRIVLCLPPATFAARPVTLPLTDLRKVREILPVHLQSDMALPVDEAVFDAIPLADGRFLAIWARKDVIARAIDQMREGGLEPQVVTSSPCAWPFIPDVEEQCALSDGSAFVTVRDGALAFVRPLGTGDSATHMAATVAALESAGEPVPAHLFLLGAAAAGSDTVTESLAGRMTVGPLELTAEAAPLFKSHETFLHLASACAVARACRAGRLVDLRRGDLAWTAGDDKLRRKLILTSALALLAVVLLFSQAGYRYYTTGKDLASLNTSIRTIYREIFPSRTKPVDELDEVKGEIRRLKGPDALGNSFIDVVRQLAGAKGTIGSLYEVELEARNLRVKGDARSIQAVNEFKSAVAPLMATIEVGEVKTRPDGSVTFALWGTLREEKK